MNCFSAEPSAQAPLEFSRGLGLCLMLMDEIVDDPLYPHCGNCGCLIFWGQCRMMSISRMPGLRTSTRPCYVPRPNLSGRKTCPIPPNS